MDGEISRALITPNFNECDTAIDASREERILSFGRHHKQNPVRQGSMSSGNFIAGFQSCEAWAGTWTIPLDYHVDERKRVLLHSTGTRIHALNRRAASASLYTQLGARTKFSTKERRRIVSSPEAWLMNSPTAPTCCVSRNKKA